MSALKKLYKGAKKLVGANNEFDEKTDQTRWAHCVIKPTDDDTLAVRESGLSAIAAQFSNIVSFVGPPGVGKSTLSAAIYNVQRGDRVDYFEASGDAMESFTRGIWSLNEHTKAANSAKDKVDVLDLEGIDDEDVIHYLVVIAMTLSKAILLCADYRGNPRFKFTIFKTLESGVRIFKQNNIRVPKPVIYIQVPFGMTKFKIRSGEVDKNGLFADIKKKYKVLEDFEMRTFSLPSFQNNRFDAKYMQSVQSLVEEFQGIEEPKSAKAEDRVKYARFVVEALNTNSPTMISDLNLKFLQNQIKLITGVHESNARVVLRHKADKTALDKKISYEEWCRLVCPSGKFGYAAGIKQEAKTLAYYDAENKKHEQVIDEIDDRKHCLEVNEVIRDVYNKQIVDLEQRLMAKGKEYMGLDSELFRSFVKSEIQRKVNEIEFYGSTYLPHELRLAVDSKRHELKTKLLQNTQNVVKIPEDYLSPEVLTKGWETATNTLKETWQKRIRNAIGGRKVTTSGDHTCPSCKANHSSTGVHHGGCKTGSLWYWVDPQTKYCACDGGCGAVQQITSVCCASCSTTLRAQIVPVN